MTRDFLFATWEGGGSVPPTMGAVRRLTERGHCVRVLADDSVRADIGAAGGLFVPWQRAPNRPDRTMATDTLCDFEPNEPGGDLLRLLERLVIGPAAAYAADTAEELRRRSADVLVCSDLLFGPMIAAEATGTRLAVFSPNISVFMPLEGVPPLGPGLAPPVTEAEHAQAAAVRAWFTDVMTAQAPLLNAARAAFGLRPLMSALGQPEMADRVLLATSRAFDFPAARLPKAVRYLGPLLDQPQWVGGWQSPWERDDARPLVLVGLSTTFQDQAATIQTVLDALATLPVRGLVTLGPGLIGATFHVPDNAMVVNSAPHDAVMREASLVVTHCGHGTVMRALAHGRPMLCLPMGRDQNDNAARVTARGAGLRLTPSADSAAIRDAIAALLEKTEFAAAATRLGEAIANAEFASALVDELEALAASPTCCAAA
jgi:MGT family glycosyltransferase